jgi:hypothetical protein
MRPTKRTVIGIDFSGSKLAGNKIWVATCEIDSSRLIVKQCIPGAGLPSSGVERDRCLYALRGFIARQRGALIGMDFPFALHRRLVDDRDWVDFIMGFPKMFETPEKFYRTTHSLAKGKELRRRTDIEAKSPFCANNLWVYLQTFYGIRDILRPLIADGLACVPPMQRPDRDRAIVIEICPASTLKRQGLYVRYKGRSGRESRNRETILQRLDEIYGLSFGNCAMRSAILRDPGGDALDSIIAACATSRYADEDGLRVASAREYAIEGYIYV